MLKFNTLFVPTVAVQRKKRLCCLFVSIFPFFLAFPSKFSPISSFFGVFSKRFMTQLHFLLCLFRRTLAHSSSCMLLNMTVFIYLKIFFLKCLQ